MKEGEIKHRNKYREKNPWYSSFDQARSRCTNPKNLMYKYYGARGIKFLMTKEDFKTLWERDNASVLKQATIDRIDPRGDYVFSNCRFIEMALNRKRGRPVNCEKCDKIHYANGLCREHYMHIWRAIHQPWKKKYAKQIRRTHKRWCSQHQYVHSPNVFYWSCRWPNDKKRNEQLKKNRKDHPDAE